MCSLYLGVIRESLSDSLFYLSDLLFIFLVNNLNAYPESSRNEAILYENCCKFSASESFCDVCYRSFRSSSLYFAKRWFSAKAVAIPKNADTHIQKTAPASPMVMADVTPFPYSHFSSLRHTHSPQIFSYFAFFLTPLIICGTKLICLLALKVRILERGDPSLMDQPIAERLR